MRLENADAPLAPEVATPPVRAAAVRLHAVRATAVRTVGLLTLVGVACLLPFELSDYRTFQFTQVFIYAIALLGLNMLTGYNGQISLGHGAFYGIGAYTTAIMIDRWGVPYGWTIPAAGLVCLLAGFLFGIPALRLEGLYLALATFALALAVPQILKHFDGWTGGSLGALAIAFVAPDTFNVFLSITFLVGIVVGGLASIAGAVWGALFIQFVPNWAQAISKAAPWAIYGVFLIGFMYVMPRGIAGALRLLGRRLARATASRPG